MRLDPATISDLWALLAQGDELPLRRPRYAALIAQVVIGEAVAFRERDDAPPFALAGIAPITGGGGEIWFCVRPGGLGYLLVPLVRRSRAEIQRRANQYPAGMCCFVADGHEPGERLAALLGCVPQNVFIGTQREWTWVDHGRTERKIAAQAG